MGRPPFEVAAILREHGPSYREAQKGHLSLTQLKVMRAIEICRTADLGGHVDTCKQCGHEEISYNSCRNRHCPKCQSLAKKQWLSAREAELLEVPYFHVVFTIPSCLHELMRYNDRILYKTLFKAVSQTLLTIAADPKHLGAEIGFLTVLHTWGQNLMFHPHVHCVVPGGGLSADGTRWIPSRANFFLPVRVLSRFFRSRFLRLLKDVRAKEGLVVGGGEISEKDLRQLCRQARQNEWVVYSKPPFGGPRQVLDYLGRYTHRVAISNNRLVRIQDGEVAFKWKDYAKDNRQRVMRLSAHEFIRRFLLHVLPKGLMKIRHFGFLANRHRQKKLALCRQLLAMADPTISSDADHDSIQTKYEADDADKPGRACPACVGGSMLRQALAKPSRVLVHKLDLNSS